MYPFYLGIDLHLKRTYMVLIDKEREKRSCKNKRPDNSSLKSYKPVSYRIIERS
jgi:hypothetical protein